MKRKLFAMLIAVALIVSISVTSYAAFSAESRNSVVVVSTCMDTQYGEFSFGTGTGFFINDQYLVTNHHVIDTFEQYGSGEMTDITVNDTPTSGRAKIRVYFGTDDYEEAYIVGSSKTKDVAIRKSFGCSRRKVFYETVLGFIWPVGAAALLAIPAAWYFIRHWLSKYPVQIENSFWIYISALAIVLLVVTASMAVQAARLMRTNPAEVLKKE